jgi:glucan endo-1,3-alpha-glucosidase
VGGLNSTQAGIDVAQAQAMGFDAFALNILSTDSWSNDVVSLLFAAAAAIGFHLFFSFDMTHFTDPSQFFYLLDQYTSNKAYYQYNNAPFVSKCFISPT